MSFYRSPGVYMKDSREIANFDLSIIFVDTYPEVFKIREMLDDREWNYLYYYLRPDFLEYIIYEEERNVDK